MSDITGASGPLKGKASSGAVGMDVSGRSDVDLLHSKAVGLIGVLFFPLAVSSILKVLTEFASWRLNQFAVLTVILGNLFVCLSAETTITGYTSVLIHGLFFSVGVVIFFALPRFQIQR